MFSAPPPQVTVLDGVPKYKFIAVTLQVNNNMTNTRKREFSHSKFNIWPGAVRLKIYGETG